MINTIHHFTKVEIVKLFQSLIYNTQSKLLKRILAVTILIIVLFMVYMGSGTIDMNFNPFVSQTHSQRGFDIVLSYYSEDVKFVARFIQYLRNVSTLQKLKSRTIVYNKNKQINSTYLKEVLKADIVISLPNLGREGATFLYHIIQNYDKLAGHTIFSQAGVEGITDTGLEGWFSNRLEKQFNSSVGYMPLVADRWFTTFDCGVRPGENMLRLPEFWGIIEQTVCPPGGQFVAFRGQFLASAKRIRYRSLQLYKYINDLITADGTHWIHRDSRSPPSQSTSDNPIFGHVVERLWTTLFRCTNPNIIDRCRRNECACFD